MSPFGKGTDLEKGIHLILALAGDAKRQRGWKKWILALRQPGLCLMRVPAVVTCLAFRSTGLPPKLLVRLVPELKSVSKGSN